MIFHYKTLQIDKLAIELKRALILKYLEDKKNGLFLEDIRSDTLTYSWELKQEQTFESLHRIYTWGNRLCEKHGIELVFSRD